MTKGYAVRRHGFCGPHVNIRLLVSEPFPCYTSKEVYSAMRMAEGIYFDQRFKKED